jgi:hypothetical protein
MKEQSYATVMSWKLSILMGVITLTVLASGLVARKWFQSTPPPEESPTQVRPLPMPRENGGVRRNEEGSVPPRTEDPPIPLRKGAIRNKGNPIP